MSGQIADTTNRNQGAVEVKDFFPSGAIAFFISLVVFFALIWGFLYTIMLNRS